MKGNSRTFAERIEQELLPILNLAVLLIPFIAMAMQLGSAAAGLVAATEATDVAGLETPAQTRTRPQQRSSIEGSQPAPEPAEPDASAALPDSTGDRSLTDPLLGYGI